jgi:hypothetical protein
MCSSGRASVTQIGRLLGCFNYALLNANIYIGAVTSTTTSYSESLGFESRFRD